MTETWVWSLFYFKPQFECDHHIDQHKLGPYHNKDWWWPVNIKKERRKWELQRSKGVTKGSFFFSGGIGGGRIHWEEGDGEGSRGRRLRRPQESPEMVRLTMSSICCIFIRIWPIGGPWAGIKPINIKANFWIQNQRARQFNITIDRIGVKVEINDEV